MKRFFGKRIIGKLKSRRGESLVETLCALLIAALGLVLLAGMIEAGTSLVQRSRSRLDTYYEADNHVAAGIEAAGTLTITITSDDPLDTLDKQTETVSFYENDTLGKTSVISYYR